MDAAGAAAGQSPAPPPAASEGSGLPPTLRDAEKMLIMRALDHTEGNRTHAAKMLGISVRTLRNKLHEYRNEHGFTVSDE